MSYVIAQPPALAAAATELAGIGSAISEATAAAAAPTTAIATAAADEVSTAIAQLFGELGQEYQAISTQIAAFHNEFTQRLVAAANAFFSAESISAARLVNDAISVLNPPPPVVPAAPGTDIAIIMGGTGDPGPTIGYVDKIITNYLTPLRPGVTPQPLFTPENLYPITGVRSLLFDISVEEGLVVLNNAVMPQLAAGNEVTVFGYSQSAVISSLFMQNLISQGAPYQDLLSFIMVGNEMNPNGGILARIPGLNISTLGLPFYGATPDNPYQTSIYTLEYDGFADFPRYPLNILSDINAVFGIITVHTQYPDLTSEQILNAQLLPTQGPTTTQYFIIETEHLPLLAPVRAIPYIGKPLAALLEPNLEVIVNLGYGDPRFGYSTSPANIPTPFGLFPEIPPGVVVDALVAGTQQGVNDFWAELPVALSTPPEIPALAFPPYIQEVVPPAPLTQPVTLNNIANTFASVVSTGYGVLLPTADLGLAFVTTLPAYNLTLFVNELVKGNIRAAIELPLAATFGLAALGGMIEFIAILVAGAEIAQDVQSFTF